MKVTNKSENNNKELFKNENIPESIKLFLVKNLQN